MQYEESNREGLQFCRTFDLNINNPVAINKRSEKEKIIDPKIDHKQKSNKRENLQDDEVPINNYPYEFYEESQSKSDESKINNKTTKEKNNEKSKNQEIKNVKNIQIKKQENKNEKQKIKEKKTEESNKGIKPKTEVKKEIKKETKKLEVKPKEEIKLKSFPKKEEKKNEKPKKIEAKKEEIKTGNNKKEELPKKTEEKIEKPKNEEINIKKEENKIENINKEELQKKTEEKIEKPKKEEINIKKEEKKIENPKKEEIKKESQKIEEKKIDKPKEEKKVEKPKIEEIKKEKPKKEEVKIEKPIIIKEEKINEQKAEEVNIKNPKKDNEEKIQELKLERVDYKGLDNAVPPREEYSPPQLKDTKDLAKSSEIINTELPKTLLTKKTEDNYDTMMKYFKDTSYKRGDDFIIDNMINYDDFSSDQFLGLVSDKIKLDNTNKNLIKDFLQRNEDDTNQRRDNNKNINKRIKLIDDNNKKKLYFNNKKSQQEYFDSFYNKQIQYQNNYKENLDKIAKKYDEENKKNFVPEPKTETNLNYFQNNEPVKLSKYCYKFKNQKKINEENNGENSKDLLKPKIKKLHSFDPNLNQKNDNYNNLNNDGNQLNNNSNSNKNNDTKKLKNNKSGPLFMKNEIKLSKKEIEELTNKLHYDGELLKIKKQAIINDDLVNNINYHNFSKEKLSHSSIIILIKKILYEYSVSIKNNAFVDYTKNPKINYEQYIDILKDLYYLERDALPEDYLEEDTMYKELWNKLTKFSKGPENSIESNVFLIFLLELNGFFNNEKILKTLENEIYWIKLEEYDDLIANAKYIEENWDDLKNAKIKNIKKLKMEGKYNHIHCEEIYGNNISLTNGNSNKNGSFINQNTKHFITTFKGNTNYHMIHGYNSNNKNSEISLIGFYNLFKDEENKHNSFSLSNASNKNLKNRLPLKDSYNDLIAKKKSDLENMQKDKEEKLKEICTFKPKINNINTKKMFSNTVKVELPKHKQNKSVNLNINSITKDNTSTLNNNNNNDEMSSINQENLNIYQTENNNNSRKLSKYNNHNYLSIKYLKTTNKSQSPNLKKRNARINQSELKRNKSNLQKMFEDNPLKNDKIFNEKIQKLKLARNHRKQINYNNYFPPMRFDIEYPSKFEGLGITITKDTKMKQKTQNIIFYNIKVNEKIKTLKYIEGDDLKLNVINFVRKNRLPEEVTDIILTKIKEKTIEEIF